MRIRSAPALAALASAIGGPAAAASEAGSDGIDEVFVVAGRSAGAGAAGVVSLIEPDALRLGRAASVSTVLRRASAAAVQTNSRGETLAYFRGAGERQTAVFFAGAPINSPWDNRLNLDLVPAGVLSSIAVSPGPTSVLYGAAASGGLIELTPAGVERAGGDLVLEAGSGGLFASDARFVARTGGLGLIAAIGGVRRTGDSLAGGAGLDLFQPDERIRTNTGGRRSNVFVRAAIDDRDRFEASASLLHVDGEFGVAPEGRSGEATPQPRFWRYPEQRTTIGVLNGRYDDRAGLVATAAAWVQANDQRVNSFADEGYRTLDDVESDRDRSYGVRGALAVPFGAMSVRTAATLLDARHGRNVEILGDGARGERFRRRTVSVAGEIERAFGAITFNVGAGGEFVQSIETGALDGAGDFSAFTVSSAVTYSLGDRLTLSAAASRKPRFPTDRELYGEAVGRFVLNPDLGPEFPLLMEASLEWRGEDARRRLTPFASLVTDAIDQETVLENGESFRRRINLDGARAVGVELDVAADLTENLSVIGNLTYVDLRARGADRGRPIPERPDVLAFLAARYVANSGFAVSVEAQHTGRAFATDVNAFAPLPRATTLNAELSYTLTGPDGPIEVYLRADNLNDALVEPQFGLPAGGRLLRGGLCIGAAASR